LRETVSKVARSPLDLFSRQKLDEKNSFWALRDVSFEVMPGEIVGIIGRNGAGKSTLLKILARVTEPTCGRIELYGHANSLLEVGTGFHPELTGRENIFVNGAILGMKSYEIKKLFDEIVHFAEVEQFLDTAVKHYSSGMYMRLAFSVAAHLNPDILIIDEVLSVGDAQFQKKCIGKVQDVARNGRTVLFVSHNIKSITDLCHRAVLLKKGTVEFNGDIEEVVSLYLEEKGINEADLENLSEVYFYNEVVSYASVKQVENRIHLTVEYEMPEPISMPCLGFSIIDKSGNPICGTNPRYDKVPKLSVPAKSGKVKVIIKYPQLINGIYRLSIWFGTDRTDYFERRDCLTFKVSDMILNQHTAAADHGYVYPQCEWEFENV
jgi:lipopolysaccharide transport system ATP-binding protein